MKTSCIITIVIVGIIIGGLNIWGGKLVDDRLSQIEARQIANKDNMIELVRVLTVQAKQENERVRKELTSE